MLNSTASMSIYNIKAVLRGDIIRNNFAFWERERRGLYLCIKATIGISLRVYMLIKKDRMDFYWKHVLLERHLNHKIVCIFFFSLFKFLISASYGVHAIFDIWHFEKFGKHRVIFENNDFLIEFSYWAPFVAERKKKRENPHFNSVIN